MLVIKSPHLFFPLTFFKLQHMLAHSPLSSMYEPTTTRSYTPPLANFQRLTKMTLKLFSVPPILIIFIFFQFSFSTSDVNPDQYLYESCANTFSCGSLTGITYPFSGNTVPAYCGYPNLNLNCKDNVTTIEINNMRYRVLGINQSTETMRIAREDLMESSCPQDLANTTLNNSLFQFSSNYNIVTFLYNCPNSYTYSDDSGSYSSTPSDSSNLDTVPSCAGYDMVYYVTGDKNPLGCNKSVMVPVYGSVDIGNWTKLEEGIRAGFDIKLKLDQKACHECTESKGRCGFNVVNNRTACYCSTTPFVTDTICSVAVKAPTSPPVLLLPDKGSSSGTQLKLVVSIAGAVLALFGIGLGIFAVKKRRNRANSIKSSQTDSKDNAFSSISKGLTFTTTPSVNFSQSVPSYTSSKLDSSKSSSYFGVQVFTYTELEEATNNFDTARELGEGGFGTVYYGKLKDDRIVAVKRLYENNYKRIEQFMNELDILTRLRHDNLVTLYGCTSRRSRELLLVYEYIPNGTVADHLYGKGSNTASLTWLTRLKIAFETADALAYLHKSDIIHRDVKTNNILLDDDFQVKVADFGLSRLFPTDVTHVSTAPQGTPGYVDPEYHNCYQLTEKSDVYSFGVVLIELISSKQAVDTNRNRLDINLANMAINRIQNGTLGDLVDTSLGFDTDSSVRRMITLVAELAFRCLQTERDMRPSMVEVLKALKRIKDGKLSEQQEEVVEIVIEDDVALLKGRSTPVSPRSQ